MTICLEVGKRITRKMMKDSGMSDSSFYRFQDKIQKKMKKVTADMDKEMEQEAIRQRFKRNTKPAQKKTLWQRIKGYFYVN